MIPAYRTEHLLARIIRIYCIFFGVCILVFISKDALTDSLDSIVSCRFRCSEVVTGVSFDTNPLLFIFSTIFYWVVGIGLIVAGIFLRADLLYPGGKRNKH